MADKTDDDRPKAATADSGAVEAMEKQIAQLRREIGKINKALAERAEEAVEDVEGWYESASDRAARATQALRARAQTVSGVVQANPGTISSAMFLGGVLGLMVGLALGQPPRHRGWFDRD